MLTPSNYVGSTITSIKDKKWYPLWSTENPGFGTDKGSQAANTLFNLVLAPKTVKGAGKVVKGMKSNAKKIYHSNSSAGQKLRYVGGKFKYGFDVKLPDLVRRTSKPMEIVNGKIQVSNPDPRFIYKETGKTSPTITNFTTDWLVVGNNGGDWTGMPFTIINGKALLGKNVISTQPMDTFTFGNNIRVPKRYIKYRSKSQHKGDLSENALWKEFEEVYKRPTLKDYEFMDYVFQPKYESGVIPKMGIYDMNNPFLIEHWSSADMRPRWQNHPWENVMYKLAPTVEDEFRTENGIVPKPKIKTNK